MHKLLRWAFLLVLVGVVVTILAFLGKPESKDYISYWCAGKLLAQHGNPYSIDVVFALEKAHGYTADRPLVMRNMPWSLFLALPLGWMSLRVGLIVWLLASISCVALSLQVLRVNPKDRVLAYCFSPLFACMATGQSSTFLLLGLATFLAFHRSRPWLAGAGLLLMASKPHVFFAFWPLLLIDSVYHRRWRVVAYGAAFIAGASAIALVFNPHIFSDYLTLLHTAKIFDKEAVPSPSFFFRKLINVNKTWLQIVPCLMTLPWVGWYYARNRHQWDWSVHITPLLFVCVLASPYVWMTDEVVLLPAIMLTLAHAAREKHAATIFMVLSGIPILMLLSKISLPTGAYVWTSTAWFLWYIYCRGLRVLASPTDRFTESDANTRQRHTPSATLGAATL